MHSVPHSVPHFKIGSAVQATVLAIAMGRGTMADTADIKNINKFKYIKIKIQRREEKHAKNTGMNNRVMMMSKRSGFRTFHLHGLNYRLVRSNNRGGISANQDGLFSTIISCVNYGRLLPTSKAAHSQLHFCTNSSTTTPSNNTSSSSTVQTISDKLPDPIEQQCEKWIKILRAEWEAENAIYIWHGKKLRCTKAFANLNASRLFLSTEDLNPEQLRILHQLFRIGDSVELKHFPQQSNSINLADNLLGIVVKKHSNAILVSVKHHFNLQQRQWLQQSSFDIKKAANSVLLENRLNFLAKRHVGWCKWPGYIPLLQAFKCLPLPEDTGVDPVDWVASHGKNLDPSQCAALNASLNLKRPIVAVHGPPGSGKTHLLAEYLQILSQQRKRVLVCSKTNAGFYHLIATFCTKFPSAASNNGTFLCLKAFDAQLASKVVADKNLERLIEKKSFVKLRANDLDVEMRKHYQHTKTLKLTMENKQDYSGEEDLKREAEDMFKEMRETGHRQCDERTRDLLQSNSILFMTQSNALLNLFTRNGLTFDVVIIDDAALFPEFESWMMALSTAPILRLFGDYHQSEATVHSSIGRELNFNKSLIQRLDEQFGPEVNFHLRRQYRSNAAIQAWPNRAFYGQRAAEPDESVRNIRLDDLLEAGKQPPPELITDPLVLVDLSKLEGEWRDWMFKAEKGGKSWFNWAEAFLAAFHLWHLFDHLPQLCPSRIAYLTHYDAQRTVLWRIFSTLSESHLQKFGQIRMEHNKYLQGQQFDVVLRDSVTILPPNVFTDSYNLKHLNNEICRARRQFIWFANSEWLERGSEQSRQLLHAFSQHGRIVGPNELMPLETGQFSKMTTIVEENFRKTQQQRMRTNVKTTIIRR